MLQVRPYVGSESWLKTLRSRFMTLSVLAGCMNNGRGKHQGVSLPAIEPSPISPNDRHADITLSHNDPSMVEQICSHWNVELVEINLSSCVAL